TAIALECGDRRLTYQELDDQANQLGHYLRAAGIKDGSRVAILIRRSVEMYVALLGIGKAGGAFVPIDPDSPADRISYILDDSHVDLVLTSSELVGQIGDRDCLVLDESTADLAAEPADRPVLGYDSA